MSQYDTFFPLLTQAHSAAEDFLTALGDAPPFPPPHALQALAGFDEAWPQSSTDPHAAIALLSRFGSPAATAFGGGRYFGFVMGGCYPVGLAANWLAGAWDQNAVNATASPLVHKIEAVTSAWILEALDLPRTAVVGYVTGASMANLSALAVARTALYARAGWNFRRQGADGAPRLRVVIGAQAHPSVQRALTLLGFGADTWQVVPTDDQGRMDADALPPLDARTMVVLQAGNVNSGSFDLFSRILERAAAAGAWVHVDGAFGLWARASQRMKALTAGVEGADSWAVDGHKWLNVPYDSAVYVCRHADAVADTFDVDAPYLLRTDRLPNAVTMDLSRRARAVEIWAVLRSLGREGLQALVDRCCHHARTFAARLSAAGFTVLNDVVLNQVVAQWGDGSQNDALVARIQADGVCWLGPTVWNGHNAMRISVSSWATTEDDVERSVAAIVAAAKAIGE